MSSQAQLGYPAVVPNREIRGRRCCCGAMPSAPRRSLIQEGADHTSTAGAGLGTAGPDPLAPGDPFAAPVGAGPSGLVDPGDRARGQVYRPHSRPRAGAARPDPVPDPSGCGAPLPAAGHMGLGPAEGRIVPALRGPGCARPWNCSCRRACTTSWTRSDSRADSRRGRIGGKPRRSTVPVAAEGGGSTPRAGRAERWGRSATRPATD